jgi:hypothetical protein
MISKLFNLKHPIVKISLFSKEVFEFELHPKILQFSENDIYMSFHWFAMDKIYKITKKILHTERY